MLTTLALLGAGPAAACGGFACNQNRPVLQAAERIVFGLDEERGEVEMHVQITYTGDAEDFAWIVPVPGEPDLFLTTSALFNRLALRTAPRFVLNQVEEGHCSDGIDVDLSMGVEYAMADAGATTAPSSNGSVTVVGEATVGPYETVTLRADSSEALLAWLDQNGFELPPGSDDAIAPYVSASSHFVALKLRKDADVGDLAPLALRWSATKAIVPVQLTSVSATPDMRMEAYVFGDTRAVPESYLHVQINDAAIDWWGAGQNYADVITEAADEAGGHAFATDYYGESSIVGDLFDEAAFDEASVRSARSATEWIERVRPALLATPPEIFEVIEDQLTGVGEGNGQFYFSCPSCFEAGFQAGVDAATDDLILRVIEPMQAAQSLVDHFPRLSRMTSSLDAAEMTVDPVFVLNADMKSDEVRRRREADMVYECGNGRIREAAKRRLVLADGREIELPSQNWMNEHGLTDLEYIEELGDQKAQIIEETGATGKPKVIADYTDDLFELVRLHNGLLGCGCDSGAGTAGGTAGVVGLLGLLAIRRRRA